jgi:hypothetical protein
MERLALAIDIVETVERNRLEGNDADVRKQAERLARSHPEAEVSPDEVAEVLLSEAGAKVRNPA